MWHSFLHMDKEKEEEEKEKENQPWKMASLNACHKSQGTLEWPSEIETEETIPLLLGPQYNKGLVILKSGGDQEETFLFFFSS